MALVPLGSRSRVLGEPREPPEGRSGSARRRVLTAPSGPFRRLASVSAAAPAPQSRTPARCSTTVASAPWERAEIYDAVQGCLSRRDVVWRVVGVFAGARRRRPAKGSRCGPSPAARADGGRFVKKSPHPARRRANSAEALLRDPSVIFCPLGFAGCTRSPFLIFGLRLFHPAPSCKKF